MRKRGSWSDCKSQYTTLFAEQQKFIDRLKLYSPLICLQHNFNLCVVGCNSTMYFLTFLGAEIYEKHY